MSKAPLPSVDDVVTDIEDLGVLVSKINIHVFKFEVTRHESSLYVKRTNPGPYPVIVHPSWKSKLDSAPIAGIEIASFHEGTYKNSNLSHFPRNEGDASPHGLAVAYQSKAALRSLLNRIGRQTTIHYESEDEVANTDPSLSWLDRTEREAVVRARRGQGLYRTKLLGKWDGKCSVTGLDFPSLLRASHIKPWKDSSNAERLDGENGLLLIPNLDAAFDAGLVTFSPSGGIVVSTSLSQEQRRSLGISQHMQISSVSDRLIDYLRYHSENVFNH